MKQITTFLSLAFFTTAMNAQNNPDYEILKTESHISGLKIALIHKESTVASNDFAILFLHGSSFGSALSFGFKMNNYSWIDNMSENGYDVYALDFLGYGNADRYPEMETNSATAKPVGRVFDVCQDVDKAVDLIIKRTGKTKVYLIGHSWGGSVAALYAAKFPDKVSKLVLFAAITQRDDTSATEKIESSFELMTPEERINAMKALTPEKKSCQLEPEIFKNWGNIWLKSDPLAEKYKLKSVRFPSGPSQDVEDLLHNKPYYNPADIKVSTLVVRGEWDKYPNNADDEKLFSSLENVPYKKYIVIKKGTHVMHLEKSRYQLYNETLQFLKFGS
ncbi:alpha/beta hydrolase [Flavobacterium sp. ANB]|uniref:alpha/beta hydrolase n=1 Tax=unclassified Flavobacterium TaxID=196869 RepID=UPI0012B6B318|nr:MULTISPECIES: alpha/beta hydrolase [unclassified Flavobacterium]MBF4516979.1 alpha/beta hydrolase [Flavobacterium sp. ANB]MTD69125.1 alpha/beta fold hydrolase [Flavobacterium sp. LC2016-13]